MANQSSTPFDQGLFLVHLNRGREHFDKRNFADAAEELEEARRLRPDDDSVLNLLGLAYFKQEKYKEADSVYRKLIELNPESYTLHFNLGLVCFKIGSLDDAEAIFLRALELKPENQKTHFYLGNIYEKKRQYYNAIFQYRKAGANIMVKRVQDKIDQDRPAEAPPVEQAAPPPVVDAGATHPEAAAVTAEEIGDAGPDTLEKVNVDHIDRRRFLTALQEGLFTDGPPPEPGSDAEAASLPPVTSDDASGDPSTDPGDDTNERLERVPAQEVASDEPLGQTTAPMSAIRTKAADPEDTLEPGTRRVSDTQEEVLSGDERARIATVGPQSTSDDETVPPREGETGSKKRLRLTEPLVPDNSLEEMTRARTPEVADKTLFTERRGGERRGATPDIPPAESVSMDRVGHDGQPKVMTWAAHDKSAPEANVYSRMRRRDDIFRYLENNLMEVNFSGKVFIKQGTIYSYSGNLTFWVKPQRDESSPPLVIVSGTGKLLLTDRQRDITVLQIEDEEIFVEPTHLLACQETLTPQYAVIEKDDDGTPGLHVLLIKGTGVLALSVATSPLLLPVQKPYPVNVSSSSLISWSGDLTPTIVEDEALNEIMLPGPDRGVNLRLEGEGRVMMEKSSGPG